LLSSTVLKLVVLFGRGIKPRAAAHLDTSLVALAVFNGHLSGKPLTTNKLALYLGMPRTTAQTRLDFLVQHDYAWKYGRYYYIRGRHMLKPPVGPDLSRTIILDAAERLRAFPR
jgi:hypothetical protein